MADEDPLGPRVRALFADLAHAGDLAPALGGASPTSALPTTVPTAVDGAGVICTGEAGRAAEGTRVRFSLRLSGTRVEQVRYRAYGCPFTLAACEWLARQLTERQLSEASAQAISAAVGTPAEWAAALGVPPQRLGRLLVVEDALRQAMSRNGGAG
jgi:NifU-like protein involved in Fe-S cluster formation